MIIREVCEIPPDEMELMASPDFIRRTEDELRARLRNSATTGGLIMTDNPHIAWFCVGHGRTLPAQPLGKADA